MMRQHLGPSLLWALPPAEARVPDEPQGAERRRPGRMRLELSTEPGRQIDAMIHAYRQLVESVEAVMEEVGSGDAGELARLDGYRRQFLDQLEHWRAIARRADAIVESARR